MPQGNVEPHSAPKPRPTPRGPQLSHYLPSGEDTLAKPTPHDVEGLNAEAVLEFAGCSIEAVLLLADSRGAPAGEFAWCIALPARHGRATLGRFVIPARHDRTRYRALLGNLLAVAAWADWHEPDTAATPALDLPGTPRRWRAGTPTGTAPTSTCSTSGGPSGMRTPLSRPGRRWPRGEGNTQVRRIRIAPLLLNAHLGGMTDRVYRLPGEAGALTRPSPLSPAG